MDKNPFIGQLNRKITVKSEVFARDADTGEDKPTLQTIAELWSFMQEKGGDEDVEGKVRHLINRSYIIRWHNVIAETANKLKVVDGNVTYNIYHVKEIGRKRHLELLVANYD